MEPAIDKAAMRGLVLLSDQMSEERAAAMMFRVLTWCCVAILAILSLLPATDLVRTGLPSVVEHFIAYGGSAAIATFGYGDSRDRWRIAVYLTILASVLEPLQHFIPGRYPGVSDFLASSLGAVCGVIVTIPFRRILRAD